MKVAVATHTDRNYASSKKLWVEFLNWHGLQESDAMLTNFLASLSSGAWGYKR